MPVLIDQYSVSTVPLDMFFNETNLSVATGFVWQEDTEFFLITNWHNLSGRDPFSGKHISTTAAEPNKVRVWWNLRDKLLHKFAELIHLQDPNGAPLWWVHPQLGNQIDVVALPVASHPAAEMYPINKLQSESLAVQVGMDVFICGYPFGLDQAGLPIWKRGSLASEPDVLDPKRPYVLIDTASRPGMSGSPIVRRSWGTHLHDNGHIGMGPGTATKFFGVYSGRLATTDPLDAQLGLAWQERFIGEILAGRQRDA